MTDTARIYESEGVWWKVFVPPGGLPADVEPDRVVWIDVAKLDAAWPRDYLYIERSAAGNSQHPERYHRFGDWLARGEVVEMASICLDGEDVTFADGRHRFAWMRDHGAVALPVAVCQECEGEIERRFGINASAQRVPKRP